MRPMAVVVAGGLCLLTSGAWAEPPGPPAGGAPAAAVTAAPSPRASDGATTGPSPRMPPPHLSLPAAAAVAPGATPSTRPLARSDGPGVAPPPLRPDDGLNRLELFGWIASGAGLAAITAGVVVAGVAASKFADLDCPEDSCPSDLHDELEAYNSLRMPAGLLIMAGGFASFVGGSLLALGWRERGRSKTGNGAAVKLRLGPGSIVLRGHF